jgi:uncharacterized damage-inducible protein DinB
MPSLKTVALGDLEHELSQTRRVLERVPDEHLGWRPHPKSWPLGSLALHVATLPAWNTTTLTTEMHDLAGMGRNAPPASRDEILATFDRSVAGLKAVWEAAGDAALGVPWTLRFGEREIFTLPRGAVLRSGMSHLIHHRAQLTVYLRLLDVPVPGLYGPSADETF